MTRKDYELIASAIEHEVYGWKETAKDPGEYIDAELSAVIALAKELAERLEAANPRFDRNKFLVACGITI